MSDEFSDNRLMEVLEALQVIENDIAVPRNIREGIKNSMQVLKENNIEIAVKINRSLQELEELSDNPNIPVYTRTQLWNIVSLLESVQ
ncbi:UPF0147 family protein [Candidatus Woesearchaeota archaeon]|nr:UPF0147 family protein [Candidatus Woesearchaeota archaeon]